MWSDWRRMSLHKGEKHWGSHNESPSLTKLRMTYRFAGGWRKADLPVNWCHPDSSGPVTEGRNSCVKVGDHVSSKSWTSIFRNTETVMALFLFKQLTSCRFRASTGRVAPLRGSIPVCLQCTGTLWQIQCQLDEFCRGYKLVLCYRRVIDRQQQMLLQYTELYMTAICCYNRANFGIIIFLQSNFQ
jgi:hypothetical protein